MLTTAHAFSLKGRDELKSFFRNKSKLSETHFAELIHATLNKRDDRFHGGWKAGRPYQPGDVVYHDGKLWEMTEAIEICGSEVPGSSTQWRSGLKQLEDRVTQVEHDLQQVQRSLQTLQQTLTDYQRQTARFLSLLTLGVGFLFLWLAIDAVFHWT
jgi:hypothetical protein